MVTIQPLIRLEHHDLLHVVTSYVSEGMYVVEYRDTPTDTCIELHYVTHPEPTVRTYHHIDTATIERYTHICSAGCSFGAYDDNVLVGFVIAEPQEWNSSLWVWEFHVAPTHRRQGVGRQLLARAEAAAKQAGLRVIVCETQNTNAGAIMAYRKLGFRVEGVDISYYSNSDYPNSDIAIFMKRQVAPSSRPQ